MAPKLVSWPYPEIRVYEGPPLISGSPMTPQVIRMLEGEWAVASGTPAQASIHEPDSLGQQPPIEDLVGAIMDKMYGDHCAKAVVKCQHCGQWAARFCACGQCGAPVD
jgi:hypothetical protein